MPVFKDFVEQNNLEFYSIGADPAKLMAYMVLISQSSTPSARRTILIVK